MKEKKRKNRYFKNKKSFVFVLVLCLGVGFAYLTSNLTITGNTSVSGNRWSIYFDNLRVSLGSVEASVEPFIEDTSTTSLEYTINLDKPGDFYEFLIDAKNDGTIDGMIENINLTSLDSDVEKYLNYTATYFDGSELSQGDVIKRNTTATYKVRVEYKKDISASDLDENGVHLDLSFGINYVQSNKKPTRFIDFVKNMAMSDENLNFLEGASNTNGIGLFVRADSEEASNPIYYYRGTVDDNNVKFAGFCWQIVRTTDTGGTKLIYNGEPKKQYRYMERIDKEKYNFENNATSSYVFNRETREWSDENGGSISFSIEEDGDYTFEYNAILGSWMSNFSLYKDDVMISSLNESGTIELFGLSSSTVFRLEYENWNYEPNEEASNDKITFSISKGIGEYDFVCTSEDNTFATFTAFNTNKDSLAYSGYMYGTVYEKQYTNPNGNSYLYGNSFTYSNGTYTLSNTRNTADSTHHYTCFNSTGTCSTISYIYYDVFGTYNHINLTEGKGVEDAIREMQTNTNDSTIKIALDNWFGNTFRTYFTANNKDYNEYLEDTIWCNDRSISDYKGWNPNGTALNSALTFGAYGRKFAGTPSLICPNKRDSFTVNESEIGNGALTYPVGLLTADEIVLAGANEQYSYSSYLKTGTWTMSPAYVRNTDSVNFLFESYRNLNDNNVGYNSYVRPVISLSSNVKMDVIGDGSATSPYEFIVD